MANAASIFSRKTTPDLYDALNGAADNAQIELFEGVSVSTAAVKTELDRRAQLALAAGGETFNDDEGGRNDINTHDALQAHHTGLSERTVSLLNRAVTAEGALAAAEEASAEGAAAADLTAAQAALATAQAETNELRQSLATLSRHNAINLLNAWAGNELRDASVKALSDQTNALTAALRPEVEGWGTWLARNGLLKPITVAFSGLLFYSSHFPKAANDPDASAILGTAASAMKHTTELLASLYADYAAKHVPETSDEDKAIAGQVVTIAVALVFSALLYKVVLFMASFVNCCCFTKKPAANIDAPELPSHYELRVQILHELIAKMNEKNQPDAGNGAYNDHVAEATAAIANIQADAENQTDGDHIAAVIHNYFAVQNAERERAEALAAGDDAAGVAGEAASAGAGGEAAAGDAA